MTVNAPPADLEVPVERIMTRALVTIEAAAALDDARRRMTEGGWHHLPVVRGRKLVGIVSSADLARATGAATCALLQAGEGRTGLAALASGELVTLAPTAPVREALALLATGRWHAIPVVSDDGDLLGLVSTTDAIRHVVGC